MKRFLSIIILTHLATVFAQTGTVLKINQSSWQQKVDHEISATLDVKAKILRCEQTIYYTNNSPDVLKSIPFHIWPNAFSSNKSAYGNEAIINGNNKFLSATKEERGSLDSLSFTVNGKPANFAKYEGAEDIIEVVLPEPLQPGASISIHTPFKVKIPFLFSRMGYSGSLFSITQWYPKPAVYDVNGWNTFSYLEQGEYFSEFGKYTVNLTLPENYIVGATGVLQEESEKEWLSELADNTAEKRNAEKYKTLHFVQENVSDFAWFADHNFSVAESSVQLPGGRKIHTYALVTSNSSATPKNVVEAIETALLYYSKRVGEYPYDYCTAVIGELKAAGGMEYPMITICGDGSEGTIIHEVGHNWFQGMLGSQERRYPWMDESINTFYQNMAEGKAPKEWESGAKIDQSGGYMLYRLAQDLGVFQSGNIHSEAYQSTNYGTIVYATNPLRLAYLQEYLGKKMMDSCMKMYFKLWHFKHPLPGDLQATFEKVSGQNLNWFFGDLLGNAAPDVSIKSIKNTGTETRVKISNEGKYSLPICVEWTNGKKKSNIWIPAADTTIVLPKAEKVRLNPSGFLPEMNMANNDAKTSGAFRKFGKLEFKVSPLYKRGINNITILPNLFTFNRYDGYTPGIVVTNYTFPRRTFEWWINSSYGLSSNKIVGSAGLRRNIYFNNKKLSKAEVFINSRSYSFMPDSINTQLQYGNVHFGFAVYAARKKPWVQHSFGWDMSSNRILENKKPGFNVNFIGKDYQNDLLRFYWKRGGNKTLKPSEILGFFEAGNNFGPYPKSAMEQDSLGQFAFIKIAASGKWYLPYYFMGKSNNGLRIHAFASGFLTQKNTSQTQGLYQPVASGASGKYDYTYSEVLMGRSEALGTGNFYSRQLVSGVGALRMLTPVVAKNWVAGLNLTSSIIPKVPIHIYGDVAFTDGFDNASTYWVGGINISQYLGSSSVFEVNLPIVYSSNLKSATGNLQWYELWNFKLNLNLYEPFTLAKIIYK